MVPTPSMAITPSAALRVRWRSLWLGLCVSAGLVATSSGSLADETPTEIGLLIDAPGAAFVYETCTACHAEDLIVRRGRDAEGWTRIVGKMMHDYRMVAPTDEEFATIIGYLSESYPKDTSRPWWRFW